MAERLILTAELVDEVSEQTKKLGKSLREFYSEQKKLGEDADKREKENAKKRKQHLDEASKGYLSSTRELKALTRMFGEASPALGRLGDETVRLGRGTGTAVGSLAAFGAVGVVTQKLLGDFGQKMLELRNASREAGVSVAYLRTLEQVGPKFGLSVQEMQQTAVAMGAAMEQIKRHAGPLRENLVNTFPQYVQPFFDQIERAPEDFDKAFDAYLEISDRLKKEFPGARGEQLSDKLAGMLGFPTNIARIDRDKFKQAIKEYNDIAKAYSMDPAKYEKMVNDAIALKQELAKTKAEFENIGIAIASNLLEPMKELVKHFNETIKSPIALQTMEQLTQKFTFLVRRMTEVVDLMKWIENHVSAWTIKNIIFGNPWEASKSISKAIVDTILGPQGGGVGGGIGSGGIGGGYSPRGGGGPTFRPGVGPGARGTGGPQTPGVSGPAPRGAGEIYDKLVERFKGSPLDGYVPADGAEYGINKGTPQEWAKLALAGAIQESSLNPNASGGGLYQFEKNDLLRYGVTGNVNDPNAQIEAMARQYERSIPKAGRIAANYGGGKWGGAAAYFGPFRRPWEIKKHFGQVESVTKYRDSAKVEIGTPQAKGDGGAEPIPHPEAGGLPGMAKGGIVRRKPGGTQVVLGEGAHDEAVLPIPNAYNNPGDLKWGQFAREHGSIGRGARGGHAVFPDYATGRGALEALLTKHGGESIGQMNQWYAPGQPWWGQGISKRLGVGMDYKPTTEDLGRLADAVQQVEGYLNVNVNAPPGTHVKTTGEGMFKTINTRRTLPDVLARTAAR